MSTERHQYLVSRGYRVVERHGRYIAFCRDEAVSGPLRTREAAWRYADVHSYYR